jgi:hypothetical protein
MKIPVFVSSPTTLSIKQENARKRIVKLLDELGFEPRALGRSDYPSDFPLKEVLVIAKHCAGGVILGFEQFHTDSGTWKRGSKTESKQNSEIVFPTPWNNLEAGILYSFKKPLIVFKESNIKGGVFDNGVSDVFIHQMPIGKISKAEQQALKESLLNWQRKVRANYYDD